MRRMPSAVQRPLESRGMFPFRRTVVASTTIDAQFADVRQAARTRLATLVTEAFPPKQEEEGRRDLVADLFMDRRARRFPVRVLIEVEGAYGHAPGLIAHLRWGSQRHPKLFPSMEADLLARPHTQDCSELIVHGTYHPPYGLIGLIGDLVLGRLVARLTARAFVEELGRTMESAIADDRRFASRS